MKSRAAPAKPRFKSPAAAEIQRKIETGQSKTGQPDEISLIKQ
jgi:hypothetical protein